MIQRKPASRLGYGGPEEVKDHPWLRDSDWNRVLNKDIEAPYTPIVIIKSII